MLMGTLFLGLALLASFAAVVALLWGRSLGEADGEPVTNLGYLATFAAAGGYSAALLTLLAAFFRQDFKFMYVAENHPTDVSGLAWLYKLSGLWAGREGSLLFWAWLLALFAAYVAYKRMDKTDDLSNMGVMVTNIVLGLFGAAMMFSEPNNPFKASPAEWLGANGELLITKVGMNPLLQHWAMILHPPTLFIGYAGLTIAFAFAMAALIVNDSSKAWVEIVDRITVFSWLFLGAGIGLGSIWAYVVLGWGGYWAWDPVENASLLPWLTGVALIHSFTVYRRRDGFKRWAIFSAAISFSLVVLGTFITRSGIVQSVHAFQEDPVSKYLFGFMIVAPIAAAVFGLWFRGESFSGNDEFESLTSKEAAYYFNNVLMILAGIMVAYMTVTSAIPIWFKIGAFSFPPFAKQSIGIGTYNALARPVGILYAFILAACPILSWRKTEGPTFWNRAKWPLVAAGVIFAALATEWYTELRPIYDFMVKQGGKAAKEFVNAGPAGYYHALGLLAFLAAALIISTATYLFIDGARKRAAAKGDSFFASLGSILFRARTQSGGYLAHIGIGIILIGLVGSAMYVRDVRVMIDDKPGQSSFKAADYTFLYQGTQDVQLANGDVDSKATFQVSKDGKVIGTMTPGLTAFARQDQTRLNAAVRSTALADLFVVWEGNQDNQLSVNVKVNPLIWFAWGGFIVLLIGASLAAWPKRRAEALSAVPSSGARAKGASKTPAKSSAKYSSGKKKR